MTDLTQSTGYSVIRVGSKVSVLVVRVRVYPVSIDRWREHPRDLSVTHDDWVCRTTFVTGELLTAAEFNSGCEVWSWRRNSITGGGSTVVFH